MPVSRPCPRGEQWTVERFGRYTRTLQSGLCLIVPFIDRIGRRLSVMEQVLDVPAQTVISKDNAAVIADGVVFYRVQDTARAAYQVQNLEEAIVNLTTTNLRSVIGSMDLDDTLSKRAEINEILMAIIDEATKSLGRQDHAHRDPRPAHVGRSASRDEPADDGRAQAPGLGHRGQRPA